MKKTILTAMMVLSLAACTDPQDARRVLEDAGYTQVEITGYRMTGCSQHDNIRTGFKAKGATGRQVTGVVCSEASLFGKSNTIRID